MSICENCGQEIEEDEVQCCKLCGYDCLGNCCIGVHDHNCPHKDDDNEEKDND